MGYTVISPSNPRKSPKWRCSWEYHHLNMVFNLTIWPDEMTLIGLRPLIYESSNARPSAADFWHSWRQISQHKASRMVQDGTGWYKMVPAQNGEPQLEPETSVNVSRRPFHHHRMRVPQRCPLHRSKLPGPYFVWSQWCDYEGMERFCIRIVIFFICVYVYVYIIYIYIIKRYIIFYVHPFSIESWATTKTVRVAWRNLKKQSTITSWHLSFPFSIGFWVCVRVEN